MDKEQLYSLISHGNAMELNRLLIIGLNPDSVLPSGEPMIVVAACMGDARLDITMVLVENGANVNTGIKGKSLLKWIKQPGYCDNEQTIAYLVSKGAIETEVPVKVASDIPEKNTEATIRSTEKAKPETFNQEKSIKTLYPHLTPGIKGWLLLFVIGCFLSFALNLGLLIYYSAQINQSPGNIVLLSPLWTGILALFALITGISLISLRSPLAVWIVRIYLIIYLIGSLIVALTYEVPGGYYLQGGDTILYRSVFSAILFNFIWQAFFSWSKQVKVTYYQHIKEIRRGEKVIDRYYKLFDIRAYGINYWFGIAYITAHILMEFFRLLAITIDNREYVNTHFESFLSGYLIDFVTVVFEVTLLIVLSSKLRNEILLSISTGFLFVIGYFIYYGLGFLWQIEGFTNKPELLNMAMNFKFGFLLIWGFLITIRYWGLNIYAFIIAFTLLFIINYSINFLLLKIFKYPDLQIDFWALLTILDGIILSTITYGGFIMNFRKRGYIVRNKELIVGT